MFLHVHVAFALYTGESRLRDEVKGVVIGAIEGQENTYRRTGLVFL